MPGVYVVLQDRFTCPAVPGDGVPDDEELPPPTVTPLPLVPPALLLVSAPKSSEIFLSRGRGSVHDPRLIQLPPAPEKKFWLSTTLSIVCTTK